MKMFAFLLAAAASISAAADGVDFGSLLDEMLSRQELSKTPIHPYRLKMYGSWDKATKPGTQGTEAWVANNDNTNFIRIEENEGRKERVLLESTGPGAVVRFWVTIANTTTPGTIRFYVDGEKVLEGQVWDLLSGRIVGGSPICDAVSPQTSRRERGYDFYLPVPYAESCKITYESAALDIPCVKDVSSPECFYYNIEAREYVKGVSVKGFRPSDLVENAGRLRRVNMALAGGCEPSAFSGRGRRGGPDRGVAKRETLAFDGELKPGESRTVTADGEGAVEYLRVRFGDGNSVQELREIGVSISFDGETTVSMPACFFFGKIGDRTLPYKTRFTGFTRDWSMECGWYMPFAKSFSLTFSNGGDKPVLLSDTQARIVRDAWDSARSMHFGATCSPLWDTPTRKNGMAYDGACCSLSGTGRLVGCGLYVRNTGSGWWGEGDEKIYIDGEDFPSIIGTGSEDFFGYAWSRPETFEHPFLAQPDGSGAWGPGPVWNFRARVLDSVYFTTALRFDLEVWHHNPDLRIDWVPVSYWYRKD